MTFEPWRVEDSLTLLDVQPWLRVRRERVRLPDGRVLDDYYQVDLPDFVVIVARDDEGRVLAMRHYRHGARATTLGLPAGYVEPNESALVSAQRELLEETGFEARRWRPFGRYVVDCNRGCGFGYMFLAEDLARVSDPDSDDLEDSEIVWLSESAALTEMRESGAAEVGSTLALSLVMASGSR